MGSPIAIHDGKEMSVSAVNTLEFHGAREQLIAWAMKRTDEYRVQRAEAARALDMAIKNKWSVTPLRRRLKKLEAIVNYYDRMRCAFEHGFIPVPNLPGVEYFAMRRRNRKYKGSKSQVLYFKSTPHFEVNPDKSVPAGEGEYVGAGMVYFESDTWTETSGPHEGKMRKRCQASEYNPVDFPLVMARPRLMEATTRAMEIKAFDRFGILQSQGDPLILAELLYPTTPAYKWNPRRVTFMVAWQVDTQDL